MKKFPSPEEFQKKLEPELRLIHEIQRPIFALRAYELAMRKAEMERTREEHNVEVAKKHKSKVRYRLVLTQLRKAIASIQLAQQLITNDDGDLWKNFGVERADQILRTAKSHLEWMVDGAPPGNTAPGPEWLKDTLVVPSSPQKPKESVPEFGVAKIDYWFIGELDKLFDIVLTPKLQIGKFGRDRIIQKIFEIAFGDSPEFWRNKNARVRMAKKRHKTQ